MTGIHDLRSALDALARAGERPVEIAAPRDPHVELIDDYLASYRMPDTSWFCRRRTLGDGDALPPGTGHFQYREFARHVAGSDSIGTICRRRPERFYQQVRH
ncbi:hypothetical protein [Burkholderia sp. BCC0397]|uniref:hypothetical protein n=1 Tax=Burkholderia sp. BCC0397 TaxID=486876 RepID=UPI001589363E|nr:hypothetical protein [Burkholderia sp. BCC0397]